MRWLSLFLIILSGAGAVSLIAQDKPVIRAPLMKAAPLIDGALGAGEWAEAAALAGLTLPSITRHGPASLSRGAVRR